MTQLQVHDIMTPMVITVPDDTPFAEIAEVLAEHRIKAVAITDRFDAVVGVVSWTDLIDKINFGGPDRFPRRGWLRGPAQRQPRRRGGNAVQVMSAPPVTIRPDASLPAAARVMYLRGIGRLLVTDRKGRLQGIVTRADLLKVHARSDGIIRDEVTERVLRRTLLLEPGAVHATVENGVVTLTGTAGRKTTAITAVRLAAAVAGVTDVVDELTFSIDDTGDAVAGTPPTRTHPLRDWWTAYRPARPPANSGAALDGRSAYHDVLTRSVASK